MIDTSSDHIDHFLKNETQVTSINDVNPPQKILLPLSGKYDEGIGIAVAGTIAQRYGSTVVLLHNNIENIDGYIIVIEMFQINFEVKLTLITDFPTAILKEANNQYDLVVFSSHRKKNFIDKFFKTRDLELVAEKINCDVLQIFPALIQHQLYHIIIPSISTICILLTTNSNTTGNLMSYVKGFIKSKNTEIMINYIAEVPDITPLSGIEFAEPINKERELFEKFLKIGRILLVAKH